MYYVNDGVYGSFNCILYDHAHCMPTLHKVNTSEGLRWGVFLRTQPLPCPVPTLQQKRKPDEVRYPSSIWGPTCDGLDRIVELCSLPDLQLGDWLVFENMGAYTVAASSTFNGFQKPDLHYVMSRPAWCVRVTVAHPYRKLMSKPHRLLQATCAADLLPGEACPCRGVVLFRGGGMWPGKQRGRAGEALPSQRGVKVSYHVPTLFTPSTALKILL